MAPVDQIDEPVLRHLNHSDDIVHQKNHPTVHNQQQQQNGINSLGNNTYKLQIVWRNVFIMSLLHIGALYGAYLMVTAAKYQTVIAWFLMVVCSALGLTAGAHRLWSHHSYKANLSLRALLCIFQTLAVENSLYYWCRDHRVHHKYSETDSDPHNASRGFFFSHIGWLLCRRHPDVLRNGQTVDMSDLWNDPMVRFQHRYYRSMALVFGVIVPTLIPIMFWSETLYNSFFVCFIFRYIYTLNNTWLVNSAAHLWGNRPYDVNINPRESNFVNFQTFGEGFHNYHHTFPWDYSASELDWKYNWNFTTFFIDSFARIGWVSDRKRVSHDMVISRVDRTGDLQLTTGHIASRQSFVQFCLKYLTAIGIGMAHLWIPFFIRFIISLVN
ncbi:acyl-CoA desaturase 1-like [Oppia nitens]|uniref:acyl-CoA desaturase 1-like n=1 Tax=Oppia nitens TaxID=1686743 RepID=UPI0023D999F7|nr:acyl-CoA desaturase 1-like [Oppia nitens]